jgi:hypothetical protein
MNPSTQPPKESSEKEVFTYTEAEKFSRFDAAKTKEFFARVRRYQWTRGLFYMVRVMLGRPDYASVRNHSVHNMAMSHLGHLGMYIGMGTYIVLTAMNPQPAGGDELNAAVWEMTKVIFGALFLPTLLPSLVMHGFGASKKLVDACALSTSGVIIVFSLAYLLGFSLNPWVYAAALVGYWSWNTLCYLRTPPEQREHFYGLGDDEY